MDRTRIGIVMGSDSDWAVMQHAARRLKAFEVPYEARVVSAHRTPDLLFEYAQTAAARGLACIIAGAGGAAHLPGMLAAKTTLPVLVIRFGHVHFPYVEDDTRPELPGKSEYGRE